jgi:hypothetical protein
MWSQSSSNSCAGTPKWLTDNLSRRHLEPPFGVFPLDELKPSDVEAHRGTRRGHADASRSKEMTIMDLYDVMRTTHAVREFTDDPLPHDTLYRILDNARFAPSGGNRQGAHIIVVRDAQTRQRLAQFGIPATRRYIAQLMAGENPWNPVHPSSVARETIDNTDPPDRAEWLGPQGPSPYWFAFWLSIMAGGPLRARPRPPLRCAHKARKGSVRSQARWRKPLRPDLALPRP